MAAPLCSSALRACDALVLEQLVDQLPAAQATDLQLAILEGLSLRQAAFRCSGPRRKLLRICGKQLAGGG